MSNAQMPSITMELHQNNSGGGDYWISGDTMHEAMLAAGFVVDRESGLGKGYHYLITIVGTDDADKAYDVVSALMKKATGFDGSERGCDCCGAPFTIWPAF